MLHAEMTVGPDVCSPLTTNRFVRETKVNFELTIHTYVFVRICSENVTDPVVDNNA